MRSCPDRIRSATGDNHLQKGEPELLGDLLWPEFGWGELFASERVIKAIRPFSDVAALPIVVADRVHVLEASKPGRLLSRSTAARLAEYREFRAEARAPVILAQSSLDLGGVSCGTCGRFAIRWSPPGPRAPGVAQPV